MIFSREILSGKLQNFRIILASRSSRRQQLLSELGIRFEIISEDFDENYPAWLEGEEIALFLARFKAQQLKDRISVNEILITADTIVWCNGKVLGKPAGKTDAKRMLREISGNTHKVITGVSIFSLKGERTFADTTEVTFDSIEDSDIDYYIDEFSPFDKAGSYGIQEWIGLSACSHIKGSYFNVVGLPVQRLYRELISFIKESES